MSNFLDRFSNVQGGVKQGQIKDYISKISPTGDFTEIVDVRVILNSWSNILTTPRRTYIDDPEYGSELYKFVFAQADDKTIEDIKNEIAYSLRRYDDRAKIIDIKVEHIRSRKGFVVNLFVEYDKQKEQLKLIIDENIYFNILRTD
ncbi:MAG: Gene 25-like lysozyme [candidate division CPR1 bacterium ADurb.Bin160]|uniref:Gene 25-like lysozyme n=1 Tax=candidate division CPR1 bacterium ADurb.Bin160 TaxID=1852826 RepID=A0A1V5ZPA0_9BACT|nr:MAG: Gene 25-like lysozyme [candidate division CPR1 bacterium ADurb.Bin160]